MNKSKLEKSIEVKKMLYWIGIFVILIFCELFFFRKVIINNNLIGDRGDGRLTTIITEHWYNFFTGKEKFGELAMFYPISNVLSYSDLFFFYGIIHSCFRFLGMDMFNAYKYTLILIHLIGTVSMFYLLYKKLNLQIIWCLFGTIAFSFSSTYSLNLGHTQLGAYSMLPILMTLMICFFKNLKNRRKKNIYAILIITWYLFILYNTWYIAFYTALFCLTFIIIYAIELIKEKKNPILEFFNLIKNIGIELVAYIVYIIILLIPFIKLYLPVLKRSGGYKYVDVSVYMPEIIDLINVDESNWLLGNFIKIMKLKDRPLYEANMGFSIVLLITFIIFSINFIKNKKKSLSKNITLCTIIAILVSILISIKLSSSNVSFWYFIYKFIPGASTIRAMSRYLLFLTFPMAIVTSIIGNMFFEKNNSQENNIKKYIPYFLLIILWISNIRTDGVFSNWNRKKELLFLSNVSKPLDNCKIFYIIDSSRKELPEYIYQNDAFEIANHYQIKTINGNSSQFPPNWDKMYNPMSDTYAATVFNWVKEHHLENLCSYNQATNQWKESNSILGLQFYTNGVRWENDVVRIPPNGVLYGPYISLPAGKYKIEFINEFEGEAVGEFGVATPKNGEINYLVTATSRDKILSIEFELKEETHRLEFTAYNKSGSDFIVKDLKLYTTSLNN